MSPTICVFGTYRKEYARNQLLMEGLRVAGWQVIECHEPLWKSFNHRVEVASGGWRSPTFLWQMLRVYVRLIRKHHQIKSYDLLFVAYPGYIDIFLAKFLSLIRQKPLVWDVLNSLYLMMTEREVSKKSPLLTKFVKWLEPVSCNLADMLFLDNEVFVDWFKNIYQIDTSRFRIVTIGADDRYFTPASPKSDRDNSFHVLYYGSYLPNHGVEYIIGAANLLREYSNIFFVMIGDGPSREKTIQMSEKYQLSNIKYIDWVQQEELLTYLQDASVVLGAFGTSIQLQLTNNNKVFEGLAMGKPVITGKSQALPRVLKDRVHLLLCDCGSSEVYSGYYIIPIF